MTELNKVVWLFWAQGWDNAPWIVKRVRESWEINNPTWDIKCLNDDTVKEYLTTEAKEIIFSDKKIQFQARSDIIRLSLLKKHGGIWADATFLCMQPLDSWVYKAIESYGFWSYSAGSHYCAWFIVSNNSNILINKFYDKMIEYWRERNEMHKYFWLDELFSRCVLTDNDFRNLWENIRKNKSIWCKYHGELLSGDKMLQDDTEIKNILLHKPPFGLKLSHRHFEGNFKDKTSKKCLNSNGYYAVQLSKRKFVYNHF